jgi:hypothetical protein
MKFIGVFQQPNNRSPYHFSFLNANKIIEMLSIKEFRAGVHYVKSNQTSEMWLKTKIIIAPSTGQTIAGQSIGTNVFYSHIDAVDIVNELEKGSNNEE